MFPLDRVESVESVSSTCCFCGPSFPLQQPLSETLALNPGHLCELQPTQNCQYLLPWAWRHCSSNPIWHTHEVSFLALSFRAALGEMAPSHGFAGRITGAVSLDPQWSAGFRCCSFHSSVFPKAPLVLPVILD